MKKVEFDSTVFVPFVNIVNDTGQMYQITEHLEGVKRFLFKGKEGTISQKAAMFLSSNLNVIFKELEERGLEPAGENKQMQFLTAIIHHLKEMPQVKITFAFEPTITFIAQINSEISQQLGTKILLDIVVDQFVVAGAVFDYNGKYSDQTIGERIDKFIEGYVKSISTPAQATGVKDQAAVV